MISLKELIVLAQKGDNNSKEQLIQMYNPLLLKESMVQGCVNEDLYQELCCKFFECLYKFKV